MEVTKERVTLGANRGISSTSFTLLKDVQKQKAKYFKGLVEQLEKKNSIGVFCHEEDYLKHVGFLLASTDETLNRRVLLEKIIREHVRVTDRILEVGVGNMEVTPYICRYFNHATLVDNNKRALDSVDDSFAINSFRLEKINKNIQDARLPKDEYDMAVLSHVMYYIDTEIWSHCLKMVYGSLKPGGVMVVVMSGGKDKEKIGASFGGNLFNLDQLIPRISEAVPGACQIIEIDSDEEVLVNNEEEALIVSSVYLNDAGTSATRKEVLSHIQTEKRSSSGLYRFEFIQKFAIVKKPLT